MRNILIINQYSSNKGDRAVLVAILNLLKKFKEIDITVSTSTVSEWQNLNEFKVRFVPWGWDYHPVTDSLILRVKFYLLRRVHSLTYSILRTVFMNNLSSKIITPLINPQFLKAVKVADLVISTGGHHITTLLSKNAISSQIFDLACCLVLKKKVILWSQSIGPLKFSNKRNQIFIKKVISNINEIYIRENNSLCVLSDFGINTDRTHLTFESVLSMNALIEKNILPSKRTNKVGISIYSTITRTPQELNNYVRSISAIADHCVEKLKCIVVFIPMELMGSGADDRWLIRKIVTNMTHKDKSSISNIDLSTIRHFELVQTCKYFIGHKTHSVIFALAAGTPVLAIAYHPKTKNFMEQYGLLQYVLPDDELSQDGLMSIVKLLNSKLDEIGSSIFSKSRDISLKIDHDFSNLINNNLDGKIPFIASEDREKNNS